MKPEKILETCLYAEDLNSAKEFYQNTLGLKLFSEQDGRHLFFKLKEQMFLIFNPQVTSKPDVANAMTLHGARGPGHVAFSVNANDLGRWRQFFKTKGIAIEQEIDWPQGGQSIYIRDPAGNSIEFATPALWGIAE